MQRYVISLILTLMAIGLTAEVRANSLTLEFRPSDDLAEMVSCTLQLAEQQFVVVEVVGAGFALQEPIRWSATEPETRVMLAALAALLSDDPASVPDPFVARLPDPPFVSVLWMASMTHGLQSGLYIQEGFDLPPVLDQVIERLLVGGPCAMMTDK
jgi:hypothetical protein